MRPDILPPFMRELAIIGAQRAAWIISPLPARVVSLQTNARTGLRLYDTDSLVGVDDLIPKFELGATITPHHEPVEVFSRGVVAIAAPDFTGVIRLRPAGAP